MVFRLATTCPTDDSDDSARRVDDSATNAAVDPTGAPLKEFWIL